MSTREGAVFDLDYQRYPGTRTGRREIFWSIVWDGIRRAMGIGRRFRAKLVPWAIIGIAGGIAAVMVTLDVFLKNLEVELPSHSEYFDFTGSLGFLFMAYTAPEFLVPDRVHGALDMYRSRPVSRATYLAARVVGLALIVLFFNLFPQLVLFLGRAISSGEFVTNLRENFEVLWQVPLTALGFFAAQAAIAFPIASYAKRRGTAAAMYVGTMLVSLSLAEALRAVWRHFAHLALLQHPYYLKSRIFNDLQTDSFTPQLEGFKWWASLAVIVVTATLAGFLVRRRYRRLL